MSRKTLQCALLVLVVSLSLAYPLIELVDHWDAPGQTSDSELQVLAVLTFAGALFLLTQSFIALALYAPNVFLDLCLDSSWGPHVLASPLTASPPLTLRI